MLADSRGVRTEEQNLSGQDWKHGLNFGKTCERQPPPTLPGYAPRTSPPRFAVTLSRLLEHFIGRQPTPTLKRLESRLAVLLAVL